MSRIRVHVAAADGPFVVLFGEELRQIRQKRDGQRGSVGLATGHRHIPVVDKSHNVLGVVSIKDILWAVAEPSPV